MGSAVAEREGNTVVWGVSPQNKSNMRASPGTSGSPLEARADPDAQTTVTDFLDFTEYLPSDTVRSLTLIGKLNEAYAEASVKVDELTTTWGRLPTMAPEDRPAPAQVRAEISEHLNQAVSSRVFAHAEAVRMSENVGRHYHKAQLLLEKLQNMMENYPTEEQKSPLASPQMARAKLTVRSTGEDGQKTRRHRVPRITVPGEVLAPYDIEYDTFTDDTDVSSDEESDIPATVRRTPATVPRIKLLMNKTPKSASRPSRPPQYISPAMSAAAAANAEALLHPPPPNAVIGSADAPWLQLTQYELAKLRKRMKKNATWTPSETMVARELKALSRGPEEYREAKRKAEAEGKEFDPQVPSLVVDDESGAQQLPPGAISVDSLAAEEVPTSNRGMKLNEAKKIKREALAKMAAEEAEESARMMTQAAKLFLGNSTRPDGSREAGTPSGKPRTNSRSNPKRKRDADGDTTGEPGSEGPNGSEVMTSRPHAKRTKTETPVPPPQGLLTPGGAAAIAQLQTPVPIPIPGSAVKTAASPSPSHTITTSVPIKPPSETPVPLPRNDQRKSVTPVVPPMRDTPVREAKRETRGEAAKRGGQEPSSTLATPQPLAPDQRSRRSLSRGLTPGRTTPGPEGGRRPGSRGKAMSQEPSSGLANDRLRRSSTARNTPAPETKPPNKRIKRPAPGIVSTTNSGGNSAVGKRRAAPKKKSRTTAKKEKGQVTELEVEEVEVDDEGNAIDPDEPRYCLCNRVSFGTMIECDNGDNCKYEWFHLECVGLDSIPARTTKWYCPDCRKVLNIGEKGEVSARGVKK